jgi:ribosomal 50S subunit-recycling heat shock protein
MAIVSMDLLSDVRLWREHMRSGLFHEAVSILLSLFDDHLQAYLHDRHSGCTLYDNSSAHFVHDNSICILPKSKYSHTHYYKKLSHSQRVFLVGIYLKNNIHYAFTTNFFRMRLDKYLSALELFSRRQSAPLIKKGYFFVNGNSVTNPGFLLREGDELSRDEHPPLIVKTRVTVLINKPAGYVSSDENEYERPSYKQLLGNYPYTPLIHIAGRLDVDTE